MTMDRTEDKTSVRKSRLVWFGLAVATLGIAIPYIPSLEIPLALTLSLLGVGLTLALIGWLAATGLITRIAENLGTVFAVQPFSGVLYAILLTAVYAAAGYVAFMVFAPWLQGHMMTDWRIAWGLTIVLSLTALPAGFFLYRLTGLPFDPANLKAATRRLSFVTIAGFAFITYEQPNFFFDRDGSPLAMVAKKEGRVFYIDPDDCKEPKPCYSPATREKLIPMTSQLAEKYKQESWVERIRASFAKGGTFFSDNRSRRTGCIGRGNWPVKLHNDKPPRVLCKNLTKGKSMVRWHAHFESASSRRTKFVICAYFKGGDLICRSLGPNDTFNLYTDREVGATAAERAARLKTLKKLTFAVTGGSMPVTFATE